MITDCKLVPIISSDTFHSRKKYVINIKMYMKTTFGLLSTSFV